MAINSASLSISNSSDASFRAWGKFISDSLTLFGIPKTADTGQIDWGTVTTPAAANTSQGYEIRYLNDGLTPVYLKIEFGSYSAAATPSLWLTIGTGSDGAGNLTGAGARVQLMAMSNITTAYNCYASGAPNRFSLHMWQGSNYPLILVFDRSHAADGSDTNEYFVYVWYASTGTKRTHVFKLNGGEIVELNNIPTVYTTQISSQSSGNIFLGVIQPVVGYGRNPMLSAIAGLANDWSSEGDINAITLYPGITANYRVAKTACAGFWSSTNYGCALLRYD
jgi:hypothetical protein